VGSLGFEPRIANAPGWYTKPFQPNLNQSTLQSADSEAIRRPQQQVRYHDLIIKTLIKATNEGKAENTIRVISYSLRQLTRKTDLKNPEAVKATIATMLNEKTKKPLANISKAKLSLAYEWFCKTNSIQFEKPRFKWELGTPIIPTTENVTKITSASTRKYATIFTIMAETGIEGEELHRLHKNKIDTEQGIISIDGTKGHNAGTYKLKQHTAEMLREYIAKNPQDNPFPKPKIMSEIWRRVRNRLADNLKQPELKKIPLKSLRNYSGAKLYYSLPDPIAVMRHLRHKKLETTMHYLRGIVITGEEEYTVKTATSIKEATALLEAGFSYIQEIDGIKLYRKRK
jgi:integrase